MAQFSLSTWDAFIQQHPEAHLLQTSAWAELKTGFGWKADQYLSGDDPAAQAGAQVLFRPLFLGWHIAYIPKGPVHLQTGQWGGFLPGLDRLCRRWKTIFLIVEPDAWDEPGVSPPSGFQPASQSIQPPRTILLDLRDGEQAVLAGMKQKTRYNIRLAQKKGVIVRPSDDLPGFHQLMLATGQRDIFGVHSLDYYQRAYALFHPRQECELFEAQYQGELLAGLMAFKRGRRAWYFYGASSDEQRELMPTYLVQWAAIQWAIQAGCNEYDLWGIPDEDENQLEADFTRRSDGLWGVYRFKRGFGGQVRRSAGPYERVYQPLLYRLYKIMLKLRNRQRSVV